MKTLDSATKEEILEAFLKVYRDRYANETAANQRNYATHRDVLAQKVVDVLCDELKRLGASGNDRALYYMGFETGMEVMRILNEQEQSSDIR